MDKRFKPGVVYTVAEGTLFVPCIAGFHRKTIGTTDRFIVAEPPKYIGRKNQSGYWFRMIDDAACRSFGIHPSHVDKIVEVK